MKGSWYLSLPQLPKKMSNPIIVRSVEKDGIQYYVSDDCKISGMSISGLAEICGVTRQAIIKLIDNIESSTPVTNSLTEYLKPIAGQRLGGCN